MMSISSVTSVNNNVQAEHSGINMQTDSISKNIQNQIANAQKKLQELSSDDKLSLEEKMKKRQEIQQEITMLNQQLRQHQIEQRKEQQSKGASMEDMLGDNRKTVKSGKQEHGISQSSMQAMISADSSIKQAKVQGSTVAQMKGKARVLESEIKMDKNSGISTEKKEKELADIQSKAQATTTSQLATLADANKVMEEAANKEETTQNTESKMDKTKQQIGKIKQSTDNKEMTGAVASNTTDSVNNEVGISEVEKSASTEAITEKNLTQPISYTSVDIRL